MNSGSASVVGRINELRRDYDRLALEVSKLRGRGIMIPGDLQRQIASVEGRLTYFEQGRDSIGDVERSAPYPPLRSIPVVARQPGKQQTCP